MWVVFKWSATLWVLNLRKLASFQWWVEEPNHLAIMSLIISSLGSINQWSITPWPPQPRQRLTYATDIQERHGHLIVCILISTFRPCKQLLQSCPSQGDFFLLWSWKHALELSVLQPGVWCQWCCYVLISLIPHNFSPGWSQINTALLISANRFFFPSLQLKSAYENKTSHEGDCLQKATRNSFTSGIVKLQSAAVLMKLFSHLFWLVQFWI